MYPGFVHALYSHLTRLLLGSFFDIPINISTHPCPLLLSSRKVHLLYHATSCLLSACVAQFTPLFAAGTCACWSLLATVQQAMLQLGKDWGICLVLCPAVCFRQLPRLALLCLFEQALERCVCPSDLCLLVVCWGTASALLSFCLDPVESCGQLEIS